MIPYCPRFALNPKDNTNKNEKKKIIFHLFRWVVKGVDGLFLFSSALQILKFKSHKAQLTVLHLLITEYTGSSWTIKPICEKKKNNKKKNKTKKARMKCLGQIKFVNHTQNLFLQTATRENFLPIWACLKHRIMAFYGSQQCSMKSSLCNML